MINAFKYVKYAKDSGEIFKRWTYLKITLEYFLQENSTLREFTRGVYK